MKVLKARDELVYQSALLSSVITKEVPCLIEDDAKDGVFCCRNLYKFLKMHRLPRPQARPRAALVNLLRKTIVPFATLNLIMKRARYIAKPNAEQICMRYIVFLCSTTTIPSMEQVQPHTISSQACFNQWATTKGVGKVTCVMCRQPWQGDGNAHEALAKGEVGDEGYVNVGSQLGMSGYRGT